MLFDWFPDLSDPPPKPVRRKKRKVPLKEATSNEKGNEDDDWVVINLKED